MGTVELVQRRIGHSTSQLRHSKGSIVISVLLLLLGTVSVLGIASSFLVTARDGYRRQPRETFARTV